MAIANTKKREIPPTHPGKMIRKDFMPDFNLNATSMATALGVSRQTIIAIESRQWNPSVKLALLLAKCLEKDINELFSIHGPYSSEGEDEIE